MSLRIGRFFGINVFVHWSFWLLPLWVVFLHRGEADAGSLALHLGVLFAVFACVVMHEYGHALTARRFGIDTHDITLYPIGGVARLERMSEQPWEEFSIAVAGPLVNVVIAAVLGAVTLVASLLSPGFLNSAAGQFLFVLTALNVWLVVFNLLPAFPMDGGRVLRSLLALPLGLLPATRAAVAVGAVMAVLFGLAGIYLLDSPWLIFIGLFIFWAGNQELYALEMREREKALAEEEPILADLVEEPTPVWSRPKPVPAPVTVYIWDARKSEWVAQGVAEGSPAYPRPRYYEGRQRWPL